MAFLHLSAMMEHVPLYLDGCLSYISSRSLRPSPLTLKPSDPILNTASILSLHSLSPSRALSSRQVLCLLAALDTSLGRNPLVCEDSRSLLSPRRPPHLHHYPATRFFTHSPLLTFLFLYSSLILIKRQHRDRCLRSLTTRYPILEAAKGSKWYQQYRIAQVRIDCL
jgi:hypothetical protein